VTDLTDEEALAEIERALARPITADTTYADLLPLRHVLALARRMHELLMGDRSATLSLEDILNSLKGRRLYVVEPGGYVPDISYPGKIVLHVDDHGRIAKAEVQKP